MTPPEFSPKDLIDKICPQWNMFTAAKNRLATSLGNKPGVLDRLARRVDTPVQQRVAENRTTNSETLEFLSQHDSSDVRSAVAQNDNTLRSTVDSLAGDASCDVRFAMAENPGTSPVLLERLADDENPYVQDRAKRTQARLQAEETLLVHPGPSPTSVKLEKAQHPIVLFCLNLFGTSPGLPGVDKAKQIPIPITLAALAAMSKQTQLLLAHSMEQGNPDLTLLVDDTDACELISTGWLMPVPCTTVGMINFRIRRDVWHRLTSLSPAFLNHDLVSDLISYRKRKSALYPWVW